MTLSKQSYLCIENRTSLRSARNALSLLVVGLSTTMAWGQQVDFQIDNSFSLEQVVSSNAPADEATYANDDKAFSGSSSFVLQQGVDNFASNSIVRSEGSVAAVLQAGTENRSFAIIENSPGSAVAAVQIGQRNSTVAAISGGSNNTVATAQIGNDLGLAVGLVDSADTTVVYGQGGENYNGGIIVRNAPAGTVVRLN